MSATARGSIFLTETTGDFGVNGIKSLTGDVTLRATDGSIVDRSSTDPILPTRPAIDIYGNSITLVALTRGIGEFNNALDIQTQYSAQGGTLTASSNLEDIHIIETLGDVRLNTVSTGPGQSAFITAAAGSILNGAAAGVHNVLAGNTQLFANANIGAADNHITTAVGVIEAQSTTGSTWVDNSGALAVGGAFTANADGIVSGGSTNITASSPVTLTKSILSGGDVLVVAHFDPSESVPANLLVNALDLSGKALFVKAAGTVRLLAGQDLTIAAGALVEGGVAVFIQGGYVGGLDGVGTGGASASNVTVNVAGTVVSPTIKIAGGTGDDTILTASTASLTAQFPWTKTSFATDFGIYGTYPITVPVASEIDIAGNAGNDTISLLGTISGRTINITGDAGNDTITLSPVAGGLAISGQINIAGGTGDDTITVNQLNTLDLAHKYVAGVSGPASIVTGLEASPLRNTVSIDGGGGNDQVTINLTGANDVIFNVHDTGAPGDGSDTLTINGTPGDDTFLLRSNFVALLQASGASYAQTYERVNYDTTINVLQVNAGDGSDHFYVDGNSAITVLDGGAGNDTFQFGQVFGQARTAPNDVAFGDQFATVLTTVGYLSTGPNYATTAYGGDGDDTFTVYSNAAPLKLFGEAGDDTFVVRAFELADNSGVATANTIVSGGAGDDHVEYAINAPVSIDGGSGVNTLVVLGTDAADTFVVTSNGVTGAGVLVNFTNVQRLEVDGLGGDDTFDVLSTNANVVTTLIGGGGSDHFNVGGDVTTPVVAQAANGQSAIINHSVTSADPAYSGIYAAGVPVSVGNAQSGVVQVTESGGNTKVVANGANGSDTDTYTIKLSTVPAVATVAYVTVAAALPPSSKTGGGSVLVSVDGIHFAQSIVLTFDTTVPVGSANAWGRTQTIYVRAVSDASQQPEQTIIVSHSIQSTNAAYNAQPIANVEVDRSDAKTPGLVIVQTAANQDVVIGGATATYTVALTQKPLAGETVSVALSTDGRLVLSAANAGQAGQFNAATNTITFNASNWNVPFVVRATGATGPALQAPIESDIFASTSSSLANGLYSTVADLPELRFQVADSRVGQVIVTPSDNQTIVSAGNPDTYTLQLSKAPTAPVTVSLLTDGKTLLSAANPADHRFSVVNGVPQVTFDATNWNVAFLVQVAINPNAAPSVGEPVQSFTAQPQTTALIQGSLILEGDTIPNRDRSFHAAVILPTEKDAPLPVVVAGTDFTKDTDTLTVFNAGSISNDTGTLGQAKAAGAIATDYGVTAASVDLSSYGLISGLNMGGGTTTNYGTQQTPNNVKFDGGITYHGFEVVDVLLGQGNDTFTVSATTAGSITAVQGGGGSDHLVATATAGGGASPLILLGDTTQDGSFYNSTTKAITGAGREFGNAGNDVLDASADPNTVVLYGGAGDDTILGGAGSDWIAGGSGADSINGGGGNDIVFGDSGFNLDLSRRISLASQVLLVTATTAPTDDKLSSDKLVAGADQITGGTGNEVIIGDLGTVTQIPGVDAILSTANVLSVQTANAANGANDVITLGAGNNIVLGGSGADTITALAGNHVILGDNGQVNFSSPGVLSSVVSTDPSYGGDDLITLSAGNDVVIGGVGNDIIKASNGNQTIIGDDGLLTYTAGLLTAAQTSDPAFGGNDQITVGVGNDVILGGSGQDTIKAGAGNDVILGDNGQILYASPGVLATIQSTDVVAGPTGGAAAYGDNDTITTGDGNDVILGGLGSDLIQPGNGNDIVMGDDGKLTFTNGLLLAAQTTNPSYGGNDTITLGIGNNVVFGGQGADKITAGNGNQVIVGDNGSLVYSTPGVLQSVSTSDPLFGGDDIISVGAGNDEILGGVGNDTITAGAGQSIIVGDDGLLSYNAAGLLMSVQTLDPTYGGNDAITVVDSNYILFGGAGNDTIKAGNGNNVVVGDNGSVTFASPGVLQTVVAIDPAQGGTDRPGYTADDSIAVGNGDNFILGGVGSDVITAGAGHDVVIGDDGTLTFVPNVTTVGDADWLAFGSGESKVAGATVFSGGLLTSAATTNPSAGGNDTITVGNANDIVIGGAGSDTITAGSGVDMVIGDNGAVTYTPAGVLLQITTSDPLFGGNDTITTGGGDDYILGGVGNDTISAIVGESVIFGDDGTLSFTGGLLKQVVSTDTTYGGNDAITVGEDDNILIGGVGNDTIKATDGDNIVVGDNGQVVFSTPGITGTIQALDPAGTYTADDVITLGGGRNFVLGGLGSDTITTGTGNDVVFGDDGLLTFSAPVAKAGLDNPLAYGVAPVYGPHSQLIFASGLLTTAQSLNPSAGGNDIITVGGGHELVVGGAGDDTIKAGDGTDIVIGDNGTVSYAGDGALASVATTDASYGGNDTITTGAGNDFVLAGTGNDTVLAGNGSNVVLGDNGTLTFSGGLLLTSVVALDPATVPGAALIDADRITVGSGVNFVLGGAGNDIITTGNGPNVVIGDDGALGFGSKAVSAVLANSLSFGADQVSAAPAVPSFFGTLLLSAVANNPGVTGDDTITTGTGNDLVLGGNGNDAINAGAGNNIAVGDDGAVTYSVLGVLTTIATADPASGGNDRITVADGTNYVLGGVGGDSITAGNGNDVLLGDDGQISFTAGQLSAITTSDPSFGGADVITAGAGNDFILAGAGADRVRAGNGNSVVIGDNGNVAFASPGVLATVQTSDATYGGADSISVGSGRNFVLGGAGADSISTGAGSNVVAGDGALLTFSTPWVTVGQGAPLAFGSGVAIDPVGNVTFTGGVLTGIVSTDTAVGGNDTITTGFGPNVILGGAGDDKITSPGGTNIVLGDNGQVTWTNKGVLTGVQTIDPATGGNDTVSLGDGNNYVLGGLGNDTLTAGKGDNVVLGDDGVLSLTLGMLSSIATTDLSLGGSDAITVGGGDNVVLGGAGSDTIKAADGNNLVLGDNGQVVYAMPGVLGTVTAGDPASPAFAANDLITVGAGNNFILGGAGNDTVKAGNGNNVVLGDDGVLGFASNPLTASGAAPLAFGAGLVPDAYGKVTFTGGVLTSVQTINPSLGGDDVLNVGGGNNLVLGGAGKDAVTAGDGVNIIVGDNGAVGFTSMGVLVSVATSDPAFGGDDTIVAGLGGDFILGGVGADTITAGTGNNVVIGDDGSLAFVRGYLSMAKTLDAGFGGNDVITVDAGAVAGASGSNLILGGFANDTISAADGGNVVIGDDGEVDFASPGVLATVQTADPAFGGNDLIILGEGRNFVLAGTGDDTVYTGSGDDVVFGDDGVLTFSPTPVLSASDNGLIFAAGIGAGPDGPVEFIGGVLTSAASTDLASGGNDTIVTGFGHDLLVGGAGADAINSPGGVDIMLGDNGQVTFDARGVLLAIAATDPADGGNDTITAGDDGNYIAGGVGDDRITAGIGSDVILGDDGLISFTGGLLSDVHTTDVSYGGNDIITADFSRLTEGPGLFGGGFYGTPGGNNIVLGGVGNDTITAGDGDNIVIGDNGDVSFASPGVLATVTALDPVNGGVLPKYTANDSITLGEGNNFVLGGVGSDVITTGSGNDAVIGDDGRFTFSPAPITLDATNPLAFGYGYLAATDSGYLPDYSFVSITTPAQFTGGVLLTATSLNPADGGDDTITTGDGNDLVIGGSGNDATLSGQGTNIVLGDNGQVNFTANGVLVSVATSDPSFGGNDTITAGDGVAYVAAGVGADKVTLGNGADVVIGDDGTISFTGGLLIRVATADPASGGGDAITVGSGNDILLGGVGGDTITATDGNDLIVGDNGAVVFATPGVLATVATSDPAYGGDDAITTGAGSSFILAGVGNDTVLTGDGNNVVFGDDGLLTFDPATPVLGAANAGAFAYSVDTNPLGIVTLDAGLLVGAVSTDLAMGGNDHITTGAGHDLVVGGTGADIIAAADGNNIVLGDNGQVTFNKTGILLQVTTLDPADGGNDTVTAGRGNNVILGGVGSDIVTVGGGDNVILGDDGMLTFAAALPDATAGVVTFAYSQLVSVSTLDPASGAGDTITAGNGNNLLIGGAGGDSITAGDGNDVVLGDDGLVTFAGAGILATITTSDIAYGGDDTIVLGNGNSFVLGGVGNDKITTGDGGSIILGDDGLLTFGGGQLADVHTTDPTVGGNDTITAGGGRNVVFGGVGSDTIKAGNGDNVVVGDAGDVAFSSPAVLSLIYTTDPGVGGNDAITLGDGRNFVLGGIGADTVAVGNGNDVVFGDDAALFFSPTPVTLAASDALAFGYGASAAPLGRVTFLGGVLTTGLSKDSGLGGDDVITAGSGHDMLVGGAGNDTLTAGSGIAIVVGDEATVQYSPLGLQLAVQSINPAVGGADKITVGGSLDYIMGGGGADTINAGGGRNVILGDGGQFGFTASQLTGIATSDPTIGGADVITAGDGDNVILGGAGNDTIKAGNGSNIILGDDGFLGFSAPGVIASVNSVNVVPGVGDAAPAPVLGDDTITAGGGHNFILGGAGKNTITAGDGGNVVLGGDGTLLFAPGTVAVDAHNYLAFGLGLVVGAHGGQTFTGGILVSAVSVDPAIAASNTIKTGAGHDLVIAGAGSDSVNSGNGPDIVIGDDGTVLFSSTGVLQSVASADPAFGGADVLTVGAGNSIVLGGVGNDMIYAGNGNSVLLGDDGLLTFTNNALSKVQTTDPSVGGNDSISAGNGDLVVLGGGGADRMRLGNGRDVVLGDNGAVTFFADGAVASVASSDPQFGGNDAIVAGNGDNIIVGGTGDDSLTLGSGNNVVFGDDASLTYADTTIDGDANTLAWSGRTALGANGWITFSDGLLLSATSTDVAAGGNDMITAGNGQNLVVGGLGNDVVKAGNGSNIVIGDNGQVTYSGAAIISTIQTINPEAGGGRDTITLGDGINIVLGGQGLDSITLGNGRNIALGDDGQVTFTNGSYYRVQGHDWDEVTDGFAGDVRTIDPQLGSSDTIIAGLADNLIMGGAGNDAIRVGAGNNVILGGNGEATFAYGFVFSSIVSNNSAFAGVDRISTGGGSNIVLQGSQDQSVPRLSLPVWQSEAAPPPAATAAAATPISAAQLNTVVLEAERIWTAALGAGDVRLAALSNVTVELGTLPAGKLGVTYGDTIVIDATAAGWGWFTGVSAQDSAAFMAKLAGGAYTASPGSEAAGHMDLLSTVLHELGNAMGFAEDTGNDVTGRVLEAGERRLPVVADGHLVRQPQVVIPAVAPLNLIAPSPTHAKSWIDDFVNHGGQDETVRAPNAGFRVRIPIPGKPAHL